jgi:hypothetical protein
MAKLKWRHQKAGAASAWRWYEALVPTGHYTLEALWSDVYANKTVGYEVCFHLAGADYGDRRYVGWARLFADAKALADADLERKE